MTRGIHHAADTGDATYVQALRLFMAEEYRHARDLGRVMDLAGIPRVGRTWPTPSSAGFARVPGSNSRWPS